MIQSTRSLCSVPTSYSVSISFVETENNNDQIINKVNSVFPGIIPVPQINLIFDCLKGAEVLDATYNGNWKMMIESINYERYLKLIPPKVKGVE